jgi:hypothetical protein
MVYWYNSNSSGHYPSSCLLIKAHDGYCSYLTGNTLRLRYEPESLMPSIGVCLRYINITITIMGIIHRPVFYMKHDVSETGFCLRLQTETAQFGLLSADTHISSIYWVHLIRFHLKKETESSFRTRDTPLSTKVGITFRRQVTVSQSV